VAPLTPHSSLREHPLRKSVHRPRQRPQPRRVTLQARRLHCPPQFQFRAPLKTRRQVPTPCRAEIRRRRLKQKSPAPPHVTPSHPARPHKQFHPDLSRTVIQLQSPLSFRHPVNHPASCIPKLRPLHLLPKPSPGKPSARTRHSRLRIRRRNLPMALRAQRAPRQLPIQYSGRTHKIGQNFSHPCCAHDSQILPIPANTKFLHSPIARSLSLVYHPMNLPCPEELRGLTT
jgi:hypothetical protein